MLKGLYTSALGLAVLDKRQEVSSNNLANINTIGFKKETVLASSFPSMLIRRLNDPADPPGKAPQLGNLAMGVQLNEVVTDYSRGIHRETDNPSHLALASDGYFTVSTPQGERYTRNGQFEFGPDGRLVTQDGYAVLGQNGEIHVENGDFEVDKLGTVRSGGKEIDRLLIVSLSGSVVKEGSSLFRGENAQELVEPQVVQGFLEDSNASAIEEMVNMINIMRAYETGQKAIQTQDSTLEKTVNEVGRI